jgi:hypothetical protein
MRKLMGIIDGEEPRSESGEVGATSDDVIFCLVCQFDLDISQVAKGIQVIDGLGMGGNGLCEFEAISTESGFAMLTATCINFQRRLIYLLEEWDVTFQTVLLHEDILYEPRAIHEHRYGRAYAMGINRYAK